MSWLRLSRFVIFRKSLCCIKMASCCVDYHANSAGQNEGDFHFTGGEGGVHEADMPKSDDDIDLCFKHG